MTATICILTAYDPNFGELAGVTLPHMRSYAERHGYEFAAVQRADCERPGGWIKIKPICAALERGLDYILWLDADTLVVRKDVDIRTAIQPGADLHMAWHDPDPELSSDPPHFNSGVMLIRSSQWAQDFFARVWETGQLPHRWRDQATILQLLGYGGTLGLAASPPERERVVALDVTWNSIVGIDAADDPIIHHYAGIGDVRTRLALMRADAETLDARAQASAQVRQAFSRLLGRWRNNALGA